MALQHSIPVRLQFGSSGEFATEVESSRVAVFRPGARAKADAADAIGRALAQPVDLPTLDQALVPDDRVVIALDRDVSADPREKLPSVARDAVTLKTHDPTAENSCRYLATTSGGERIHLATELVDADFVLTVGVTAFDSLLGYRGTSSVLFPGLSTVDSIKRTIGQGHQELSPREQRPLRQLVDEIAWLMGIQFTVQLVPAVEGGFCSVLAGNSESVFTRSREILTDEWLISMPERVQTVVAAISADASGHGWQHLGRTLAMARQLVEPGGRIVVLSEISAEPGEGIELLRQVEDAEDALQPLRASTP
ncbi:MAG: lactate racemase domain-containing protein, partial [Planctomycetota bacterium]